MTVHGVLSGPARMNSPADGRAVEQRSCGELADHDAALTPVGASAAVGSRPATSVAPMVSKYPGVTLKIVDAAATCRRP